MKKLFACTLAGAFMLALSTNASASSMEIENPSKKADNYHFSAENNVIEIGKTKIDCSISLPATISDVQSIYHDNMETFTNHVKVTDLGLEILTILNSEKAPGEYNFEIEAADSIRLEKSPNSEDVILVYNNEDLVVAVVENLSTIDADGNILETSLDIRNNGFTQQINQKDNDIAYPLTSKINVYSTGSTSNLLDWFYDAHWIWRSGKISLRLYAKDWCKSLKVSTALKEATWATVYNYFHTEGHWDNAQSMRKQYFCHISFGKYESDWNLEPWRPNTDYSSMVEAGCNPV